MTFRGSTTLLHKFIDLINNINPAIQFTVQHTTLPGDESPECGCPALSRIPFLDCEVRLEQGKLITDLYRKPTDRNQYLMTSSCHPNACFTSIPRSLALRCVRICSLEEDREKRFAELKELLVARGYKPKMVDSAIAQARQVPRMEAIKRVYKERSTDRPVLAVQYDPRLPALPSIVVKHWKTLTNDPEMREAFPKPPMVAYKKQPNIRDKLIRAKVPKIPKKVPGRKLKGMKKCNAVRCVTCSYVTPGSTVKSPLNNYKVDINVAADCNTRNIVYCLTCLKCRDGVYIGSSHKAVKDRFKEHKGYVTQHSNLLKKGKAKATGHHFNLPGHSESDMRITVVEKVHSRDPFMLEEREKFYINKFEAKFRGINRKNG